MFRQAGVRVRIVRVRLTEADITEGADEDGGVVVAKERERGAVGQRPFVAPVLRLPADMILVMGFGYSETPVRRQTE